MIDSSWGGFAAEQNRAAVFAVVVSMFKDSAWKSKAYIDQPMPEGEFVVGVSAPFGQVAYRFNSDLCWDLFDCKILDTAPKYDPILPNQYIQRLQCLKSLAANGGTISYPAGWIEKETAWKSRRKFECSNCGSYITGRFKDRSVEKVHEICHHCGSKMSEPTQYLADSARP